MRKDIGKFGTAPSLSGQGVWVIAEHKHGQIENTGLELVSEARQLADELGEEVGVAWIINVMGTLKDEAKSRKGCKASESLEAPRMTGWGYGDFNLPNCHTVAYPDRFNIGYPFGLEAW